MLLKAGFVGLRLDRGVLSLACHVRAAPNGFNRLATCVKLRNWAFEFRYAKHAHGIETSMTAQDSKFGDTGDKIFVGKGD